MAFGDILNTPAADSAVANFGSSVSVTLAATPPTGAAIVACFSTSATETAANMAPAGFAVASEAFNSAVNRRVVQYLKISENNESTISCGGGDSYGGELTIYVVDVAGNASPLGVVDGNNVSSADDTTPIACGSITTEDPNAVVIAAGTHTSGGGGAATPSTGYTNGATLQGNTSGQATVHRVLTATSTETPTITMAVGATDNVGCCLSLYQSGASNNDPTLDSPEPDFSIAENATGVVGTVAGNMSDADSDPLTYSIVSGAPAGITMSPNGDISANGSVAQGAYTITYQGDDLQGGTPAQDAFVLTVTAAIDQINSIADLTAGTTATLTTDGATDLTAASSITLTIDGGSAITCTAVTASTCTFDVPDDGIQLGKTVSVVLTVDGNASDAFSDTFDPALGDAATLAVDWANLHPDSPWYGDATYSGLLATHQIEHAPLTTDGKAVSVSSDGLVTIAGAATDPDHQQFDFAIIGEPGVTGTYPRSNVSTVTMWSPLKPADAVSIDSIVPTKTGATVTFSYPGSDVDSYEYNIDGGAWSAASSPLAITGQSSSTQYTFNIRPINQGSRGDTTSQQYTTNDAVDTTPDQFTFTDVSGVALGSVNASGSITVQGVDAGQDVSVAVTGGEYRVSTDGGSTWGAWTSTAGNVRLNNRVQVRGTAHATNYLADTDVTLTLDGTVSDTFTITTKADDIAPTIALIGNATVNLNEGDTYTEQGATWTDNVDGTGAATVGGDTVDTNTVGTYTVTYDYTDAAGNAAAQVTRTVNVLDASAPTITLLGSATVTHAQGASYNDAGATATDAVDGDITADITVTGLNFDVNTVGSYTIRYNVSDSQGNAAAEVTRTVNVTDQTAPTITLVGGNVTIPQGGTFNEGYSATDNNDGDITADVVVGGDTVDTNTPGVYTITYDVTDAAGNAATQRTRTVTVQALVEVEVDYIPRLLSTDVKEVMLFAGRGNRFRVQISHDGTPVDLSVFTRFELYGLTTDTLDSNTDVGVFDTNDGNGVINIDPGLISVADLIVPSGPAKTTLIGYTAAESEGVVLWQPQLSQARVTVNIINA